MPSKKRINLLLLLTAFVFGCNQPEGNRQKPDEVKSGNTILEIGNRPDTLYYDNGKPHSITIGGSSDFDSKTIEFYRNGQLKNVSEQGVFEGCGIQVGEELHYDSLGNLISKSTFYHNLPKNAKGCHDIHTIISTDIYHESGEIKLRKKRETFYESEFCDCGTWEYYDESGMLVKKEEYESCDDDKLDCAQ